jgi:hypothetical protein
MSMKTVIACVSFLVVGCGSGVASNNSDDGGGVANPCGLRTRFPGDSACLAAPTDGEQLHYGPTNYDDPADVATYLLAPGGETLTYKVVEASHPDMFVNSYEVSERSGMHHLAFYTGTPGIPDGAKAVINPALFLAQVAHESTTMGNGAPEYADAAFKAGAGSFVVAVHAINETPEPMLIEAWINLHTVAIPGTLLLPLQLSGGQAMAVPPHAKETIKAGVLAPDENIVQLVGHFHAHTTEERAFLAGKQFYSTTTWLEPTVAWFTSLTAPLHITSGAELSWECDVDNTTDATLRYANAVQTAEMCNLVGFTTVATK